MNDDLIYIRDEVIDDVGPWYWLKKETGAWDGPRENWINDHKPRIFKYIKKWNYVFQAGGCQGMYPRLYAKYFQQVITIEPCYINFQILNLNCPYENIIKIQAALGLTHQMAGINRMTMDNTGMHTIKRSEPGNIPILMIDDFELPALDLIHLDIEGMELDALKAGIKTIEKFRPVIVVENPHTSLTNFITSMDYEFKEKSSADGIFAPK